jgi:hypothetical protein
LFDKVDFILHQIQQYYAEIDKVWGEEICHAAEALERHHIDLSNVEC